MKSRKTYYVQDNFHLGFTKIYEPLREEFSSNEHQYSGNGSIYSLALIVLDPYTNSFPKCKTCRCFIFPSAVSIQVNNLKKVPFIKKFMEKINKLSTYLSSTLM